MPKIIRLELADNRLLGQKGGNSDLGLIAIAMKNVEVLRLSNNLIRDFSSLQPLTKLSDTLSTLDLSSNPVVEAASLSGPNGL